MEDFGSRQRRDDCDDGKLMNVIESPTPQASNILHIYGAQVNVNGIFNLVDQNRDDFVPRQRREGTVSVDDNDGLQFMEDTASLPGMISNNWGPSGLPYRHKKKVF